MDLDELTERMGTLCGTRLDEVTRASGLFSLRGEPVILLCLAHADEALLSGELTERCGLSTGRVANLLRQLEAKGLIVRSGDEEDRRKTYVSLTEAGSREARRQGERIASQRKALLSYLGEHDAYEFVRLLERCLDFCSVAAA